MSLSNSRRLSARRSFFRRLLSEQLETRRLLAADFASPQVLSAGSGVSSQETADLDGDGILDMLVAQFGVLRSFRGFGDGTFAPLSSVAIPDGTSYAISVVADIDDDGHLDVIVGSESATRMNVFLGRGDGTFALGYNADIGAYAGPGLPYADFDGDGVRDLVAPNYGASSVVFLKGLADGTFAAGQSFAVSGGPYGAVAADFNGDGNLDLATANLFNGSMSVLNGDGQGSFAAPAYYSTYINAGRIVAADFDRDGDIDLAVAHSFGADVVRIFQNQGGHFQAQADYPTIQNTSFLAVGDINSDGILDLVVATNNSSHTLTPLLGQGDGTFVSQQPIPTLAATYRPTIADVNGDGTPDLLIGTLSGTVEVRLNLAHASPHLAMDVPATAAAGTPSTVTLRALNAGNQVITSGFTGTVHFASSDSFAGLPADYTFTAADAGVKTFMVTLRTAGTQTVSSTLLGSNPAVFGSGVVNVTPNQSPQVTIDGLVSWYRGEGNAEDSADGNNGVLLGGLTTSAGKVGQAFTFDGVDDGVLIPASDSTDLGAANGFTIDAWINPHAASISQGKPIVEWVDGVHFWVWPPNSGILYVNLFDGANSHYIYATVVSADAYQHVAVTYDKTTGGAVLYYNGAIVSQTNLGIFTPATSTDLYIGQRPDGSWGHDFRSFDGSIDEVGLYQRALSPAEIQAIYANGNAAHCRYAVLTGEPLTLDGQFTDPDSGSWTATVDYRDGSGVQSLPLQPDHTFTLSHTYAVAGTYEATTFVTDDTGNTTPHSLVVTVISNNQPPTAYAGGPYSTSEGNGVSLNAAGSSDPDLDSLTYSWDINGDDTFGDAVGVNPSLTWSQLAALGIHGGVAAYDVRVQVDDGHAHVVTSAATTLTVASASYGTESRINTTVPGVQTHPSVGLDALGNGFAVWSSPQTSVLAGTLNMAA